MRGQLNDPPLQAIGTKNHDRPSDKGDYSPMIKTVTYPLKASYDYRFRYISTNL